MSKENEIDNEMEIIMFNLEKLRIFFGLSMVEIDRLSGISITRYSLIIKNERELTVNDIIAIASIYNLKAIDLLNPKLKIPNEKSLPKHVYNIVKDRIGKPRTSPKKIDFFLHATIILSEKFAVDDTFTNAVFKTHLPDHLKEHFKNKSIEWGTSSLKEYVIDTLETVKGKTKPSNLFKYVKAIPVELVKEAQRVIDEENDIAKAKEKAEKDAAENKEVK